MTAEKKLCFGCMEYLDGTQGTCQHCRFAPEDYDCLPHHLIPGSLLKERYIVGRVLGEGGFGITYVGRDKVLDMKVAVKEFYMSGYVNRNNTVSRTVQASVGTHAETFEKNKEKFLNEARVLAKFSDEPGIVGIRDFFLENNTAYIIMDFLDGETMKSFLEREVRVEPRRLLDIMEPVLLSLEHVHEHGVIHRDISPDNIMMTKDGRVKLLDFGAAREVSQKDIKSLSVILKPGYAPEEQYRSKGNQGPWTDVYAICATLYRGITGQVPDDSMERMFQDKLIPPAQLEKSCPPSLSSVIMKGLAVRQSDRYQSLKELREELAKAMENPNDLQIGMSGTAASDSDKTVFAGAVSSVKPSVKIPADDKDATVYADRKEKMEKMKKKETPPPAPQEPEKPKEQPKEKTAHLSQNINAPKKNTKSGSKKSPLEKFLFVVGALLFLAIVSFGVSSFFKARSSQKRQDNFVMPEKFAAYELLLNGQTIKLPALYEEFTAMEWEAEDISVPDKMLNPGSTFYADLINGYGSVNVLFKNPTDSTLACKDALIISIRVSRYSLNDNYLKEEKNSASFADILQLGVTAPDELLSAYPGYYDYDDSLGKKYIYGSDNQQKVEISFDSKEILESVSITNDTERTGFATDSYSTERPDYLTDEFQNTVGLKDFYFCLDDEQYQVGTFVQELVDKGWTIEKKPEYVGSKKKDTVYLRKDKRITAELEVYNPANEAIIPEYCLITSMHSAFIDGTDTPLTLKGTGDYQNISITPGTSVSEVKSQLEGMYLEEFASRIVVYPYGEGTKQSIECGIGISGDKISLITIRLDTLSINQYLNEQN